MMDIKYKTLPLNIKEDVDEDGIFTGYASTFGGDPDSYGDVVDVGAFKETLAKGGRNKTGIKMLWQHDPGQIPGKWLSLKEDGVGLFSHGKVFKESFWGNEAYVGLKNRTLDGMSIGWDWIRDESGKTVEDAYEIDNKNKTRLMKRVELWEISLVTFPANINATVTDVKSALEDVNNIRDLEAALRELGLSHNASRKIISVCKQVSFERVKEQWLADEITGYIGSIKEYLI
jgi:hypothetical protein